ncbi:MAG: 5'-3' exonuclease H3TH domain-containing protein [Myxococcota bacterium]
MRRTPEFLILDGTAMLFRAYFSGHRLQSPDGIEVGGVALVARRIQRILTRERPDRVAVVFDAGHRTFRHEMDTTYKGHRDAPPKDLYPQFNLVRSVAVQMGLACFTVRGFEADDLMATLVRHGRRMGFRCQMWSADKDLFQLITDDDPAVVQFAPRARRWITAVGVRDQFGVSPAQVVDYLSLVGDSADNIRGVRGVGPVTAAGLLNHFGSMDAIYENLEQVKSVPVRGARTLAEKLAAGREGALLARRMIRLRDDVDLGLPVDEIPRVTNWKGPRGRTADYLFARLGFDGPLRNLRRVAHRQHRHR